MGLRGWSGGMREKSLYHASFFRFFFQAEDGIRDRSPSRGLGDVYKRQRVVCLTGLNNSAVTYEYYNMMTGFYV